MKITSEDPRLARYKSSGKVFRVLAGVILGVCLIVGWVVVLSSPGSAPSTHYSDTVPPLAVERCSECHPEQASSLARAPHSNTLHAGSSSEMLALWGGLQYRDPATNLVTDSFEVREQKLWRKNASFPDPIPIDWVFGSGHHARTPVTMHPTATGTLELIQHGISWYPNRVGLDLTLGSTDKSIADSGWHGLGTRLNPAETADCLGCHTTWLPHSQGKIDLNHLVAGVQCARCHLHGAEHVQSIESGLPGTHIERWPELSPLESIRRCGECHRRDDHFTSRELNPENSLLVRFAPVGLSQSRCFIRQELITSTEGHRRQRLDCVTCHNPHRAAETRTEFYVAKCLNCHGVETGKSAPCSSVQTTTQCLQCHMPQVEVQAHLKFTDHWIRKR